MGVVVGAGQADSGGFAGGGGGGDLLDEPAAGADADHLADVRVAFGEVGVGGGGGHCGGKGVLWSGYLRSPYQGTMARWIPVKQGPAVGDRSRPPRFSAKRRVATSVTSQPSSDLRHGNESVAKEILNLGFGDRARANITGSENTFVPQSVDQYLLFGSLVSGVVGIQQGGHLEIVGMKDGGEVHNLACGLRREQGDLLIEVG